MPFLAQDSVQCIVGIQLIFVEKVKQLHPRDLTIDNGSKYLFWNIMLHPIDLLDINKIFNKYEDEGLCCLLVYAFIFVVILMLLICTKSLVGFTYGL